MCGIYVGLPKGQFFYVIKGTWVQIPLAAITVFRISSEVVLCWVSRNFLSIAHFRVAAYLSFKASPGAQPFKWKWVAYSYANQTHFPYNSCAPRLTSKPKQTATRKWPISPQLGLWIHLRSSWVWYVVGSRDLLNWLYKAKQEGHGFLGEVNIGEYLPRSSRGKYSPIFTELEANNYFSIISGGEFQESAKQRAKTR